MRTKTGILRILCALLAMLFLAIALASCNGGNQTSADEKKTSAAGGDEEEEAPVPHYDWGGRPFNILGAHNANEPNFELVASSDTEGLVAQEVFARNSWIESYYNVEIRDVGKEEDKPKELIQKALASGDDSYDLAFLIRGDMSTAIINGWMTDMIDLSYMDLERPWYNALTVESMKVGGRLFHLASDFSLVDKARTNVLFFNRDLAEEYQFDDDLIQLARDGEWTIEKMMKYAKAIETYDGIDGMSVSDLWGLTVGGKEAAAAFWNGLGNKVVTIDEDGDWSVNLTTDRSILSVEKLNLLFKPTNTITGKQINEDYSVPSSVFIAGNAFFNSTSLSGIESISRDANFSYSVLPYPKLNEEQQDYYTTNDNTYCATFGIPQCAADPNFSAFMIEVLSWKSHTTTYPAYTETICKVRGSYDADCYEMLELTLSGLTYDFGLMYSLGLRTDILLKSILEEGQQITSLYEGVKVATEGTADSPGKLPSMLATIANLD